LLGARQHFLCCVPALLDSMVVIGNANNTGNTRLRSPATWISCQRQRARCASMIGPVARRDFVTACKKPRYADCILIGFGAAVSEEEGVDVSGRYLCQLGTQSRPDFSGHERISIGERGGLLLNGADHSLISVPDVDAHQLTVEIDEPLSFRRP